MLKLHTRVVAGVTMVQLEGHCGARAPISASLAEIEHVLTSMRAVTTGIPGGLLGKLMPRLIGGREVQRLIDQAHGMDLLPDFDDVREHFTAPRTQSGIIDLKATPLEIDRHSASIVRCGTQLHPGEAVTSIELVDLVARLTETGRMSPQEAYAAIQRGLLDLGLRPEYPQGWLFKRVRQMPSHLDPSIALHLAVQRRGDLSIDLRA